MSIQIEEKTARTSQSMDQRILGIRALSIQTEEKMARTSQSTYLNTALAPLFYNFFRRFASVRHRISAIRIMMAGWPPSSAPVPYLAGI
jgi:hypothetical protein